MGKKYIIKLEDNESVYKTVHETIIANKYPILQVIAPAPYTEPDLDAVKKEAYQRGYEQGYKDGYNEPGKEKIQVGDEVKCIRVGWTAIVTKIKEDGRLTLMGNDGAIANGYDEKDFIKTGRHFPEIAEVLRKMREE